MPVRVHALLVVRPEGRPTAALHLGRTLRALALQTRRIDALTIVLCGDDDASAALAAESGAESVISAPAKTGYAAAVRLGTYRVDADAVWLLAQDTAPHPEALERLTGALELSPSVAFVGPKLVRWNDATEIVSLGSSMTRLGRTVGLADGELDQGQHDIDADVLGTDVRGILIRAGAWAQLGGIDPGLLGADEGLDLGVRARLAGARVALAPTAVVSVAGDGVAGAPAPLSASARRRRAFSSRAAQLHRRQVYARAALVPLLWLTILPLALWRTVVDLVRKNPAAILPEWGAALAVLFRGAPVVRARRRIRRTRTTPWSQLAPLRVSQATLRQGFDDDPEIANAEAAPRRGELRFFAGGGAWLVLGALVASVAMLAPLLAWPVLGGGALQPLRSTVAQLWNDAAWGQRALGLDALGPADPFAAVVAVLGSLWPVEPSRVLVVLWVLALPLAALGGWYAATRVTERPFLRIASGIVWALAPTFLAALMEGRPAALLVHLLLPWLFAAGVVAHRSWVPAGAASLLLAVVVACAPSLAPALVVLWAAALVADLALRGGRGWARIAWLVVPAAALSFPLVWHQLRAGAPLALLADPGVPWAGPQAAADAAGRALMAAGFPTADPGGWGQFLSGVPTWWVPLLAAPLALLALLAPLTQRWAAGVVLLCISGLGLATAFAAAGVAVSFAQSQAVALWPGAGLSLAWLGVTGGALAALDAGFDPRLRAARSAVALFAVASIAVLAVPAATSLARGTALLQSGPASTLPAYVAAEGRGDPDIGTVVLTPQREAGVATTVVWGGSETLGGHATMLSTRTSATPADEELAAMTASLVTSASDGVVEELRSRGVGFVVLAAAPADETDAARALRLQAQTSLDQRDGLDSVGQTAKGDLWRIVGTGEDRAAPPAAAVRTSASLAGVQLGVFGIALLFALPTTASRRAALRTPRVVGSYGEERA